MKLALIVFSTSVLIACSGSEPPQTSSALPNVKANESDPSPASSLEAASATPLEQQVRTDVGTAVSGQQADYTAGRGWVTADNDTGPGLLDRDLLAKMRSINPAVNSARVISVMPTWSSDGRDQYIVLANGTTPNTPHTDKFTNLAHAADIYVVFVTNRAFTKASRRIGMFVSPRTGDYSAWLIRGRPDSVIVCGHGAMYGDQKARWAFVLDRGAAERARVADSLMKSVPPTPAIEGADAERDEYPMPPRADCPWTKSEE